MNFHQEIVDGGIADLSLITVRFKSMTPNYSAMPLRKKEPRQVLGLLLAYHGLRT